MNNNKVNKLNESNWYSQEEFELVKHYVTTKSSKVIDYQCQGSGAGIPTYVDKTKILLDVAKLKSIFLARPRRMGKTTALNTLIVMARYAYLKSINPSYILDQKSFLKNTYFDKVFDSNEIKRLVAPYVVKLDFSNLESFNSKPEIYTRFADSIYALNKLCKRQINIDKENLKNKQAFDKKTETINQEVKQKEAELQQEQKQKINTINQEVKQKEAELKQELNQKLNQKIETIKQEAKQQEAELKQELNQKIESMEKSLSKEFNEEKENFYFRKLDFFNKSYKEDVKELKKEVQEKIDSLKKEDQEKINSLKKETQEQIDSLKKETQEKIDSLKKNAQEQIDSLKKETQEKIDSLKKEDTEISKQIENINFFIQDQLVDTLLKQIKKEIENNINLLSSLQEEGVNSVQIQEQIAIGKKLLNQNYSSLDDLLANMPHEQLMLMIDEYDYLLTTYLDNVLYCQNITNIMRYFYNRIKTYSEKFALIYVTGITGFEKVSFFSDANNMVELI